MEIFKVVQEGATSEQRKEWLRVPPEHAAAKETLIYSHGCHGRTLLGSAAWGNESDKMVRALLTGEAKGDVNVLFGATRESALHVAAARGAEEASRALMMAGADPNRRDGKACCPLHLAAEAGHHRLTGETPLHLAASKGHALCISELLLGGADKDAVNARGETPLFKAATNNHLGAIEQLLAAGADHSIRTITHISPLEILATRGDATILKAFLDKDSSHVHATDCLGPSGLHHAACVD
ncbi:unnamed protein product [Ectocarpus sp. CCAP 1310/34]|nr:unnamed protein product [Ectocarpus sp. CCAP 1310/34]